MNQDSTQNQNLTDAAKQNCEQEIADAAYSQLYKLALFKYEIEKSRETNLLQQAGTMQMAFSFLTIAILMIIPLWDNISLGIFLGMSSIVFLSISFAFASISQWRWKKQTLPGIHTLQEQIINSNEQELLLSTASCNKMWVEILSQIESRDKTVNDKRTNLLMWSMGFLYCSLAVIILWGISIIISLI